MISSPPRNFYLRNLPPITNIIPIIHFVILRILTDSSTPLYPAPPLPRITHHNVYRSFSSPHPWSNTILPTSDSDWTEPPGSISQDDGWLSLFRIIKSEGCRSAARKIKCRAWTNEQRVCNSVLRLGMEVVQWKNFMCVITIRVQTVVGTIQFHVQKEFRWLFGRHIKLLNSHDISYKWKIRWSWVG